MRRRKNTQDLESEAAANFNFYEDNMDKRTQSISYGKDSFTSPESSTIEGARYDGDTKILEITFCGRGGRAARPARTYQYQNVSVDVWTQFKGSSSKGKFVSEHIVPQFPGKLI